MTAALYPENFLKSSLRTPEEIRHVCEQLENTGHTDYVVKHNGNHIWLEVGEKKQEFWSPLLHLEMNSTREQTVVKGEYVENPVLWVVLLVFRCLLVIGFVGTGIAVYFKAAARNSVETELLLLLALAALWFGVHLVSLWNRRRATSQIAELNRLVDNILY